MTTTPGDGRRPRLPSTTWLDTAALLVVALMVAGTDLGRPPSLVFDEVYYVSDALGVLDGGVPYGFQAHPPLGSWLLAGGIAVMGNTPIGWRVAPLVLGVVAVVLLHRLALRLLPGGTAGRIAAAAAGVLLIVDGSWFLLSRTAMLDGPLTTLVLSAGVAAAVHAERPRRWISAPLILAGAAAGAATAVKLSGAAALMLALVVIGIAGSGIVVDRLRIALRALPVLVAIAGLVYGLAWLPFALRRDDVTILSCPAEAQPCPETGGLEGVIAQHAMFMRYHTSFASGNDQASPPSLWPALVKPVGFWRADCTSHSPAMDVVEADTDCSDMPWPENGDTIRYTGNPVTWLSFLALLPVSAAAARRDDRLAQIALAGWGLQWIPWLLATRSSFLFYMAPTVPFIVLGSVAAVLAIPRSKLSRTLLTGTGGAMLGFVMGLPAHVPGATAIVGAAVGGWLAEQNYDQASSLTRTDAMAVCALAALSTVAFLVLRPVLTVG